MKKHILPAAFWTMLAAAALTTVLRVIITPRMQETDTGVFKVSYFIIGFMMAAVAVLAVMTIAGRRGISHPNDIPRRERMPVSVSAIVLGVALIISSVFDWWQWMAFGLTPPPSERVISGLDAATLAATLAFGVMAGIFFVYLGHKLVGEGPVISPVFSLAALTPVIWIWVRIVRYEISYSSAIPVEQSFYDFVMVISTMLFLFSFSKYISKTAKQDTTRQPLPFFSLCAALMSLSGTVTSVLLYMLGETDAYNASRLAGFVDFCIGVFALCTSVVLIFGSRPSDNGELKTDEEDITAGAEEPGESLQPEQKMPTVDEILDDLRRNDY